MLPRSAFPSRDGDPTCASARSPIPALPRFVCAGCKGRARTTHRVDLDAMSEGQLEHLHAGLVKLALLDDTVLAALLEQVLADDELASSS